MPELISRDRLILSVYLPALILSFGQGMLIPVLPLFVKSFDISYGLVGVVLGCVGIGQLVSDLPCSLLLRKAGRKPTMVLGVVCMVAPAACLFWAQNVGQIIALRLLTGMGAALWNVSRHSYLAVAIDGPHRGRAISVFGGVNRIGGLAGPAVGGALAVAFGLRAPFLLYGALGGVAALATAISVERSSAVPEGEVPPHPLRHLVATVVGHWRSLATAGSAQLLAQTIRSGRAVIVPLYGADVLGVGVQSIGWIVSLAAFVDMALFVPAGIVMDRYGRKWAIVPCFVIQAVGMGLIPLAGSFWGLLGAALVMGLGNGMGSGTMMTLGADLAPKEAVGEYLGAWRLIGDGGHLGGPLLVGGIAELAGLGWGAVATSGVGFLAGAVFLFFVPETLRR